MNLQQKLIRLAYANQSLRADILPLLKQPEKLSAYILDFPETRQATNFSCGASCVQAILYYYGIEIREDNLVEAMEVKPTTIEHSGVRPTRIVSFLQEQGLQANLVTGMSFELLKQYLHHRIPVIVAIQAWNEATPPLSYYYDSYGDGHYVVAIGYNEDNVIFDDPSLLSNHAYMPLDDFSNRWHDKDSAGMLYQRLGIPVWGKTPVFHRARLLSIR